MNIGEKISLLKDSCGFKNYVDYGKAVGLSGDWLLELSKKESVKSIDITRLIKIAELHEITLDELLKDENGNYVIDIKEDLPKSDVGKMVDCIQKQLEENEVKFDGCLMNKECIELAKDGLEVLKGLIKSNL